MENQETHLSRRNFVKIAGGITFLITGYPLLGRNLQAVTHVENSRTEISAWVQISTGGTVTIYNPAAEMGQGSMTALSVLIAEEMDADWSKVQIEHSPIEPKIYGRMMTVGSFTISSYYDNLRHAGAQARYVLLKAVSQHWNVPMDELRTSEGYVYQKTSSKEISYGAIASLDNLEIEVPEIPRSQWKKSSEFKLVGKNINRFDIPDKVNGKAQFSIDIALPNMVYGFISRSPVHGAVPTLLNTDEIKKGAGFVAIVPFEYGIGVVAETVQQGLNLKRKLKIQWSKGAIAESHDSTDAFEEYKVIIKNPNEKWNVVKEKGDAVNAVQKGNEIYEIAYKNEYAYHAQMEPLNAVVSIADDGNSADVWCGTQIATGAKSTAVKALGIDASKVHVHRCYLGGGFGRRSMSEDVYEACTIAKQIRRPIKLLWTREDDVKYGAFRPMSLQKMEAGLDEKGNISSWMHSIIGTGGRLMASGAVTNHYTFDHQLIQMHNVNHGIRTKHYRAVGHGPNKFAIESFINEIAFTLKRDPMEYRKHLMRDAPRAWGVLNKVASMSNWSDDSIERRAKGIAFAERSGSLVAGVCEISVNENTGLIKVHKVWAAIDAGVVVQPDNAIAQMEGAILFGMSGILKESISIKNGEVQESNYYDYSILKMEDVPDVLEVEIVASEEAPSGIGEAGLPWVGGAIAGAFLKLTNKPIRHIPFNKERVLEVLNA